MRFRCLLAALTSAFLVSSFSHAQIWNGNLPLVTGSSSLTVSGNLNGPFGQTSYASQSNPASLTTTYTGNVNLHVDLGANTILFTNAVTVSANNSGTWQPAAGGGAGSAAANYGVFINYGGFIPINAALRSFVSTITSSSLSMSGGGASRTFTPVQTFGPTAGNLDYNSSLGSGTLGMAGNNSNNLSASLATLTWLGGDHFQLSFPVDVTLTNAFVAAGNNFTATTRLLGTFVADGFLTPVPEPGTYALMAATLGLAGIYVVRARRNSSKLAEAALSSRRG